MLDTAFDCHSGLYPKLLGNSWRSLDNVVRSLHACGAPVCAVGVFQIRHGSNWLARTLARLVQLPSARESADLKLYVAARGDGEEWRREFAGQTLVSVQARRQDGLLSERIGHFELRFRLNVVDGALSYESMSAALCLGSVQIPLPHWLSPRVTACESSAGHDNRVNVSVEAQLPWIGCFIAYHGTLALVEAALAHRACG